MAPPFVRPAWCDSSSRSLFLTTFVRFCLVCVVWIPLRPMVRAEGLDTNLYSSYKCQGGNQPGPLMFRGSMNTFGEFDEKPYTVHKRTCELTNVCFVDGKLTYFMSPEEERLVDRHDRIDGFAENDFVLLGKRDVSLNVDTSYAPVPRSLTWSPAEVAVYLSHSYSENFGAFLHAGEGQ